MQRKTEEVSPSKSAEKKSSVLHKNKSNSLLSGKLTGFG